MHTGPGQGVTIRRPECIGICHYFGHNACDTCVHVFMPCMRPRLLVTVCIVDPSALLFVNDKLTPRVSSSLHTFLRSCNHTA